MEKSLYRNQPIIDLIKINGIFIISDCGFRIADLKLIQIVKDLANLKYLKRS